MSKPIDRLGAAMFSSPSNFKEAKEMYERDLQNKVDSTWWMASNNYEIEEEVGFGTKNFAPVVCRVTKAIEPKTGLNLGDDFKRLIFFDIKKIVKMGMRFRFSDSWWIVSNTTNYNSTTVACIVRRMNNVLKFIHNGNLIEEPCVVEYAVKYSNIYYNDLVDIPQGTSDIIVQNNEFSRLIDYNHRFVLGSEVYKIKVIKDYLRQNTFDKDSVPTIMLSIYLDVKAPDDDFVNGIASLSSHNINENPTPPEIGYAININPTYRDILIGETIEYECILFKDGVATDETFVFSYSGVPAANFDFVVIDGNRFSIHNKQEYFGGPLIVNCENPNSSRQFNMLLRRLY